MKEKYKNFVKDSVLFKGIDPDDYDITQRISMPVFNSFDKGETVIGQDEIVRQIGIIISGTILSVKLHRDGGSQIIDFLKRGEIIGLESTFSTFTTSPCSLIANSQCSVVFISCKKIFDSADVTEACKGSIWQNITNLLSDENIRRMHKIDILSKRGLRERINTFLEILTKKRNAATVDIGMTQEQFSQYLGVNRSALCKELNTMKHEGLIEYRRSIYTVCKGFDPKSDN